MTLYYLAADFSLGIKLNSCLVILGIPVSIFERPGSLQFFLREFYRERSSGIEQRCFFSYSHTI
ncbi:hypothetical protein [Leptospira alexanderi]|uniref:hypothetical protein n=1 Tax=Leptospira alexanderi TaxID=100053 RepID=UPI0009911DFE